MDFKKSGYKFSLIDNPLQKHVIAWERARRVLLNEDPTDTLKKVASTLAAIRVTERGTDVLFSTLQKVSKLIGEALRILLENETDTPNSQHSLLVRASLASGWITHFTNPDGADIAADAVDDCPSWVIRWMAGEIAGLYNETQSIPKV